MQKLIIKFLGFLPPPIARLPYDLGYLQILCLAKVLNLSCWARNSYFFHNIIPGLSDIDFTIMVKPGMPERRVQKFIEFYSYVKRIMPFLGEINIYDTSDLEELSFWINRYEANRDPKLSSFLTLPSPRVGDRFIYLLRLLESDANNLIKNPSMRQKKWLRHFQEVGLKAPEDITLPGLIEAISNVSSSDIGNSKTKEFLTFYINHNRTETFQHLHREGDEKLFIILYPHRWLVAANGEKELRNTLTNLHFSQAELELIYAQLRWEINGLYSQRFTLPDKSNVIVYIDMIMNFLVLLQDAREEDFIQLINSFKSLKKILSRT